MKKKFLTILSSPYFYLLLFINVAFLVVQLVNSKKGNAAHAEHHRQPARAIVGGNNLLTGSVTPAFPRRMFAQDKIRLSIDSLTNGADSRSIVLRLVKNDCKECTDSIITNTLRLVQRFGKQNIAVLLNDTYSEEEFITYKRLLQFDIDKVFYVPDTLTSFDATRVSYYFISTPKAKLADNIYPIANKQEAGHTSRYLQWVSTYEQGRQIGKTSM